LLALCLLLVACVYARALEGRFLWDDRHLITDSEALRTSAVWDWFVRPFWLGPPGQADSLAYYRPLTALSFAFDFALHGDNSTGFHLTSLGLHLGCTAALFFLLLRRGCAPAFTFLLTAWWAVLPRSTEAVAWISGRGDVLAALFSLLALLVYQPASTVRRLGGTLLAFAALLSKESGAAAWVALIVLELAEAKRARKVHWERWALLAAPLVAYVALRWSAGANPLADGATRSRPLSAALPFEALGRYAFMLLDMWRPRTLIGQITRPAWAFVALGGASLVGLLWTLWRVRRPSREGLAASVLVWLPLLLVIHLTPLPVTVVASDRYLYLPAAGLLLVAGRAMQERAARSRWLSSAVLLLAAACGLRTFQRAGDYAEDSRFWAEAVKHSPWSITAFVELGGVAHRAGLFEEGLRMSRRAIPLDVLGSGQALDNAALMAMASGQNELAAHLGDELVRTFPRRPAFQLRRAVIALNARDFDTAQQFGERALRLSPGFSLAHRLLRLVDESRRMPPNAPPALAQRLDAEALRFGAVEARVYQELARPAADKPLAAAGVEYLIAQGPPDRAQALFQRYQDRFGADGTEAAQAALQERTRRARVVRERIAALESDPP
jgi:tetratricopeptide (TPR) repeat protein